MDAVETTAQYLSLVREFMLSIGPVLARNRLVMLRHTARSMDEDITKLLAEAAEANAFQTLQWAMYLAAKYQKCCHEALAPPKDQ